MTERDVTEFRDSHGTCHVVVRKDGALEPFWLASSFGIDDEGSLGILDTNDRQYVLAVFPAGEWLAVGEMRFAPEFQLTDREGNIVRDKPDLWDA